MSSGHPYNGLIFWFVLFFFFNGLFLPEGLLYTTLLSPMLLYYLYRRGGLTGMLKWGVLLLIPVPFQLMTSPELHSYLLSSGLIAAALILLFVALKVAEDARPVAGRLFSNLLTWNTWLLLPALLVLPLPALMPVMWDTTPISPGIASFPRLSMFAFEPSHYALLLTPVWIYFLWKLLTGKAERPLFLWIAVCVPLVLSLSFGVLIAILLALLTAGIWKFRHLPGKTKKFLLLMPVMAVVAGVVLYMFWPENPVHQRMANIIEGRDTSARGRLYESFMFAWQLILHHGVVFGTGPGQIKVLAHDLIINYYQYEGEFTRLVRIPNSMAEMLATYGLYGFMLKLVLPLYFFVRHRLWNNLYGLTLFVFIFIYQFTGSFTINAAELVIWAFAFQLRPPEFELTPAAKSSA